MIELSSVARGAYEVMIENLELTSQEEEQENPEDQPTTEPQPPTDLSARDEPEYSKLTI